MSLLDTLSQQITGFPDTIQFAKDRKYEEAWIIDLAGQRPSQQEISAYLSKDDYQLLIVEYIWNSQTDSERFVLTVFLDHHCQVQDQQQLVNLCLDLTENYQNFAHFIERFDREIIGHSYLLRQQPDLCNMSIFNHWLSVGPVDLWTAGEKLDVQRVRQQIATRPEIERSLLNYQGLLFRFNTDEQHDGPVYGLKTPCCQKIGAAWVVDYDLVDRWMKEVIL